MTSSPSELSPKLSRFVAETPLERTSVLRAVWRFARALEPGARILDAGAGDAPYRELFAHCRYVTADWENSAHPGAQNVDIVGSLAAIPVGDGSFDGVLSTQVLEHVADPLGVLVELHRVLCPGAPLCLTAPLVWELHEEPFDFFRYTPHGLRALLECAGFEVSSIEPRTGYFTTLATMATNCLSAIGEAPDGRNLQRKLIAATLRLAAIPLARLDSLDARHALPLGYVCWAIRPA